MRRLPLLLLLMTAGLISPADARTPHAAVQHRPAQDMLQTMESMTRLMDSVRNRQAADAAAPQLSKLYKEYRTQRKAAENAAPMTGQLLEKHLSQMDRSMDDFRMACARLMRENFYGSTKLGGAVKKIAKGF